MTRDHLRWLLLEQGLGACVVNLVLNSLIGWALFRSLTEVPLWGERSIVGDVVGTTLLLPLITTLVVTALARRDLGSGKLSRLHGVRRLGWLPVRPVVRGAMLGAVCTAFVAPATLFTLHGLGVDGLTFSDFVAFKASFAAALGLPVTPFVAFAALDDDRCKPPDPG